MFLHSFSGWLNAVRRRSQVVSAHRGGKNRSARPRFKPRLEALESRTVPSFVFQTLDEPNAGTGATGFQGTFAIGINASGLISGNYGDANNAVHGFVLRDGRYSTFDDPYAGTAPFQGTNALGLNDRGQIVGLYEDANFNLHGFLLSHGKYTTLDEPNAVGDTEAYGINNAGQIVGGYVDASSVLHGFLLSHGQYTSIDDPNAVQSSFAVGINASGKIVGGYWDANSIEHGYLLSHGRYTTIDDPYAVYGCEIRSINSSGQMVGIYADANNVAHSFLLSHGTYTTLDDPHAGIGTFQGTAAFGINASGQIVGQYTDANGVIHGFLATPGNDDSDLGVPANVGAEDAFLTTPLALASPTRTNVSSAASQLDLAVDACFTDLGRTSQAIRGVTNNESTPWHSFGLAPSALLRVADLLVLTPAELSATPAPALARSADHEPALDWAIDVLTSADFSWGGEGDIWAALLRN
jgi:probable HAF family extracellular repeat protein